MKLHVKTLLLATIFAFAALGLQAQEKYQYAILEGFGKTPLEFLLSIGGKEKAKVELPKDGWKTVGGANLIIQQVQKLEAEGWELYSPQYLPPFGTVANTNEYYFVFMFRKKA